jgi:hypothetical protein
MTSAQLIEIIRTDIEDFALSGNEVHEYISSKNFTLWEDKIDVNTLKVLVNGVDTSDYTFNAVNLTITMTGSLTEGDVVQIMYTYYPNYSDSIIKKYIKVALSRIAIWYGKNFEIVDGETSFTIEDQDLSATEATNSEYMLVALVAAILIKPDWAQYKALDITINFKQDMSKETKIQTLINDYMRDAVGQFNKLDELSFEEE